MGKLTHDDWCKLSQSFWHAGGLGIDQTARINDFLKDQIAKSVPPVEHIHLVAGKGSACFKGTQTPPLKTTADISAVNCASCKRTVMYRAALEGET